MTEVEFLLEVNQFCTQFENLRHLDRIFLDNPQDQAEIIWTWSHFEQDQADLSVQKDSQSHETFFESDHKLTRHIFKFLAVCRSIEEFTPKEINPSFPLKLIVFEKNW